MYTIPCSACTAPNSATNAFCASCGASLATATVPREHKSNARFIALIAIPIALVATFLWYAAFTYRPTSRVVQSREDTATPTSKTAGLSEEDQFANAKLAIAENTRESHLRTAIKDLQIVPPGSPNYKEAQTLIKTGEVLLEKARQAELPRLRERLRLDFERTMSGANPHLNFIQSKYTKTKGGLALWATHEYFSQYSLSIGDDAKIIQMWINSNREDLARAGVARVGLMGREAYAGSSWFDVN